MIDKQMIGKTFEVEGRKFIITMIQSSSTNSIVWFECYETDIAQELKENI